MELFQTSVIGARDYFNKQTHKLFHTERADVHFLQQAAGRPPPPPVAEGEVDGDAEDEDEVGPAPLAVHQPVVITKIFSLTEKELIF
jgi:hypothetical protein